MSKEDIERVNLALSEQGLSGMDQFLLQNPGKTLTALAAILDLPTQVFIQAHSAWVAANAPPLFSEES